MKKDKTGRCNDIDDPYYFEFISKDPFNIAKNGHVVMCDDKKCCCDDPLLCFSSGVVWCEHCETIFKPVQRLVKEVEDSDNWWWTLGIDRTTYEEMGGK